MTEFLKGNYEVKAEIREDEDGTEARATEAFERRALSRLGGSICFVSKKSFLWEGDKTTSGPADGTGKADRPRA
jgi:hypothetical protein